MTELIITQALKPFADLADFLDEQPDPRWQNPNDEVQVHGFAYSIGVGELHAARDAYRALSPDIGGQRREELGEAEFAESQRRGEYVPPMAAFSASNLPRGASDETLACDDCGIANPTWFAPSPLWNLVMGGPEATDDPGGFICPACFIVRAEKAGVYPSAWRLEPEAADTGASDELVAKAICCPAGCRAAPLGDHPCYAITDFADEAKAVIAALSTPEASNIPATLSEAIRVGLAAWGALPEDERNGERPWIMGWNAGYEYAQEQAEEEASDTLAMGPPPPGVKSYWPDENGNMVETTPGSDTKGLVDALRSLVAIWGRVVPQSEADAAIALALEALAQHRGSTR